jgi:hypothetical protein
VRRLPKCSELFDSQVRRQRGKAEQEKRRNLKFAFEAPRPPSILPHGTLHQIPVLLAVQRFGPLLFVAASGINDKKILFVINSRTMEVIQKLELSQDDIFDRFALVLSGRVRESAKKKKAEKKKKNK